MRIAGTDAARVMVFPKPKDSGTGALDTTKDDSEYVGSISQMTKFDKMELPISQRVIVEALERANKAIEGSGRSFEYSVYEKTNDVMIKVIDIETNQVIREIPPQKVLDLVASLCEMAGILVDERR